MTDEPISAPWAPTRLTGPLTVNFDTLFHFLTCFGQPLRLIL